MYSHIGLWPIKIGVNYSKNRLVQSEINQKTYRSDAGAKFHGAP